MLEKIIDEQKAIISEIRLHLKGFDRNRSTGIKLEFGAEGRTLTFKVPSPLSHFRYCIQQQW